jgi:hypothetical protein
MGIDVGVPDPPIRILSGRYDVVEHEVNRMVNDYIVTQWAFAVVNNEFHVTAVMLHQRELRKMQLAGPAMNGARR